MVAKATVIVDPSQVTLTDNGDGTFTCSVCGKTYQDKVKAVHPSYHMEMECEFCGEKIQGSQRYGTHLRRHRLNSDMQRRLLDLIREFPGMAPAKYAKMLNVKANSLVNPSRMLVQKGLITKSGKTLSVRWSPVEGATLPMIEYSNKKQMLQAQRRAKKAAERAAKVKENGNGKKHGEEAPSMDIEFDPNTPVQFIASENGNFLLLNAKLYRITGLEPVT